MFWGLLLAALAAAGKAYQSKEVAEDKQDILSQNMLDQQQAEREAKAKIGQSLQTYSPEQAKQTTQAEQADYLTKLHQAMGGDSKYSANNALPESVQLQAKRAEDSDKANTNLADLFGTISGAGTQRQNEAIATQQTNNQLGLLANKARRSLMQARLRASQVHANPWLSMLLSGLQAYGSSMVGAGSGAGSTASAMSKGLQGFGGMWSGGNALTGGTYTGPGAVSYSG